MLANNKNAGIPDVSDTRPQTKEMASFKNMRGRILNRRTALLGLALLLSCDLSNHLAQAQPEPEPAAMYFNDNNNDMTLLKRLMLIEEREREVIQQERELSEEALDIRTILETKTREQGIPHYFQQEIEDVGEPLPTPSSLSTEIKRGSSNHPKRKYVTLCHFKICNMGRRR